MKKLKKGVGDLSRVTLVRGGRYTKRTGGERKNCDWLITKGDKKKELEEKKN